VSYRHSIDVRYGECDMQGVVFNAHYLAYVDHAVARWFLATLPPRAVYAAGNGDAIFDFMTKRATVTWTAGTTYGETIDMDCSIARWGTTSFDVRVAGSVTGDDRFVVDLVYVSVAPGTHRPVAIPDVIRTALS
jgi:acyl-CoA thioester hydrolase